MGYSSKDAHNKYHRKYQKERYHRRRQEAIEKLGGKCVVCGTTDSLEIDHIDYTTKSFAVSRLWGINVKDFWQEIAKCQLLCTKHHEEKSKKEIEVRRPLTHGKYWAAYKHKCQCTLCLDYKKSANLAKKQARASNSTG